MSPLLEYQVLEDRDGTLTTWYFSSSQLMYVCNYEHQSLHVLAIAHVHIHAPLKKLRTERPVLKPTAVLGRGAGPMHVCCDSGTSELWSSHPQEEETHLTEMVILPWSPGLVQPVGIRSLRSSPFGDWKILS